jgi:hypothetical protein
VCSVGRRNRWEEPRQLDKKVKLTLSSKRRQVKCLINPLEWMVRFNWYSQPFFSNALPPPSNGCHLEISRCHGRLSDLYYTLLL